MPALRSVPPPSVLPDISPARGEITPSACISLIADLAGEQQGVKLLISPLAGEMSGRTEGGGTEKPTDNQATQATVERLAIR